MSDEQMIKIRVLNDLQNFVNIEVSDEIYKIIERKVIESVTTNTELQTFLQAAKITLEKLMFSCITERMVNEAVNECVTNLKKQSNEKSK